MIVRYLHVVLHPNREHPNYEELHKRMKKAGFLRVADFGRKKYFLPIGTYRTNKMTTAHEIYAEVAAIGDDLVVAPKQVCEVLVTCRPAMARGLRECNDAEWKRETALPAPAAAVLEAIRDEIS